MGAMMKVSAILFWTIIAIDTGTETNAASVTGTQTDPVTGKKLYTALLVGADLDEVKQIVGDQCSGVNWQEPDDAMAPLHVAAAMNQPQVVTFLLSCNADPNIEEATGTTPLMVAPSIDVVQALLTAHPDLDAQDEDGLNAIMMYISADILDGTKALLEAGADPDLRFRDGQTALMLAVRMNKFEHAKALLQHGADTSIESKEGLTATYIAEAKGYTDMLQLIEQYSSSAQNHTPSMLVICLAVVVICLAVVI